MRNSLFALLLLFAGCATKPAAPAPNTATAQRTWAFPADALIRQRAVLTARGRQFPLNGVLARSGHGGLRLLVTENFGQVLADVLVKPDGTVTVMRSSRMLKESWVKRYVAADLQGIFGSGPLKDCPVTMIDPSHFTIARRWYRLDLSVVEIKPGPQSPRLFDASAAQGP